MRTSYSDRWSVRRVRRTYAYEESIERSGAEESLVSARRTLPRMRRSPRVLVSLLLLNATLVLGSSDPAAAASATPITPSGPAGTRIDVDVPTCFDGSMTHYVSWTVSPPPQDFGMNDATARVEPSPNGTPRVQLIYTEYLSADAHTFSLRCRRWNGTSMEDLGSLGSFNYSFTGSARSLQLTPSPAELGETLTVTGAPCPVSGQNRVHLFIIGSRDGESWYYPTGSGTSSSGADVSVNANGSWSFNFVLPEDLDVGQRRLSIGAWCTATDFLADPPAPTFDYYSTDFGVGEGSGSTTTPTDSRECPSGTASAGAMQTVGDTNCDGVVRIAIVGDSYISGEGAADGITSALEPTESRKPYETGTDRATLLLYGRNTPGSNKCHRSSASWAARVASRLGVSASNMRFIACSGATTEHVRLNGAGQWPKSPTGVIGARTQARELTAFNDSGAVDLVFVSIGGNDVSFGGIVQRCLMYACTRIPHSGWKGDAQREARDLDETVVGALVDVEMAAPEAQVWVVGYPDPLAVQSCLELTITEEEQRWLKAEFIGPMNESLRAAAARMDAGYVSFDSEIVGHQICSGKDKAYINGLKLGNDIPAESVGPLGAESFHPNAMGHRHLADVFWEQAVEDDEFGASASYTAPSISVKPLPPRPSLQVVSAPTSSSGSLQASPSSSFTLQGAGAPPGSHANIFFNSLPTVIGQVSVEADGTWTATVSLPSTAAPGLHNVAVLADNGAEIGSLVVPVKASSTCPVNAAAPDVDGDQLPDTCDVDNRDGPLADYDGDSVGNDEDNCPVLSNTDQADANDNGFGDECDPAFGHAVTAGARMELTPTLRTDRIAGTDRYATSAAISQAAYPNAESAEVVVLARADHFADALAGGPLAAALDGPLLLSTPSMVPATIVSEIKRVLPAGGTVYLLGGQAAISSAVESQVKALGFETTRLAGSDRYSTAAAIARAHPDPRAVFIATGQNYPDALAAVPAAAAIGGVILLSDGGLLPTASRNELETLGDAPRYALGGQAAGAVTNATVLAGATRFETATLIARHFFLDATSAGGAAGESFADALAAGPFLGRRGSALLLLPASGELPAAVAGYLRDAQGLTDTTIFGGTAAVSQVAQARFAARG